MPFNLNVHPAVNSIITRHLNACGYASVDDFIQKLAEVTPATSTKGERAVALYPNLNFDTAIPQVVLGGLVEADRKYNVSGNFVTVYPLGDAIGVVMPLSLGALRLLATWTGIITGFEAAKDDGEPTPKEEEPAYPEQKADADAALVLKFLEEEGVQMWHCASGRAYVDEAGMSEAFSNWCDANGHGDDVDSPDEWADYDAILCYEKHFCN